MKVIGFYEHFDKFLKFIRLSRCLSANTLRAYKADLVQFGQYWTEKCDKVPLQSAVNSFLLSMLYNQGLTAKSIARKFSSLKTFAKFLSRSGIELTVNGKPPKIRRSLPDVLSIQEVEFLGQEILANKLKSSFPKRDHLIFELLYATGIRSFELANIKVEDIDFDQKTIKIFGKGRIERIVLFGERAKECLTDYITTERVRKKRAPTGFLLINASRTGLGTRTMRKIFEGFSTLLVPEKRITPHTLRHSFATHMLSQGVDLRVVQELLGHKRISATQLYTQISVQGIADFFKESHPLDDIEKELGS